MRGLPRREGRSHRAKRWERRESTAGEAGSTGSVAGPRHPCPPEYAIADKALTLFTVAVVPARERARERAQPRGANMSTGDAAQDFLIRQKFRALPFPPDTRSRVQRCWDTLLAVFRDR